MKFVLIVFFSAGYSGGATSAKFPTMEACHAVQNSLQDYDRDTAAVRLRVFCFPTGEIETPDDDLLGWKN